MKTCKDCIHFGVCWRQQELLDEREFEEEQECCKEASRFVEVPCKAGDKLYRIFNKPYSLDSYVSSFTETVEPYSIIVKGILGGYSRIPFEEFGKTVFLTKEDAEKALKERSEGK